MELALKNITKRYGSLTANDRISLTVRPGEIHCLLGENGAGKTTLMNVLYGLSRADEGEIFVDGKQANFESPNDAINRPMPPSVRLSWAGLMHRLRGRWGSGDRRGDLGNVHGVFGVTVP